MSVICSICNKTYIDKYSLSAHKSRYHKNKRNSNTLDTMFDDTQKMEYSKGNTSKDYGSQNEINFQSKLSPYIERLPKLFRITTNLLDDVKYLKRVVKQKQDITSSKRIVSKLKYIDRLPKLFKITLNNRNKIENVEEDMIDVQDKDNNHISKIPRNDKDIKSKINNLTDDLDYIFLKIMDLEDSIKNKTSGVEYVENIFDNTLQIIELFDNKMYTDIKYKIKELQNAALLTLKVLKSSNQLDKDNESLLIKLVTASLFEGKELLNNNIEALKNIFSYLPSEEDLVSVLKEVIKETNDPENIDIDENDNISEDLETNSSNDYDQSKNSENEEEYNNNEEMVNENLKEEISENSDDYQEMMDTDKESVDESEEKQSENTDNASNLSDNDDKFSVNEKVKDISEDEMTIITDN